VKRALFIVLSILITLSVIEGLSWLGLFAWEQLKGVKYPGDFSLSEQQVEQIELAAQGRFWNRKWDPDLGWTMTPGFNKRGQTVNSKGLCSAHEFEIEKPEGILRIAAFGDSNTEAADVTTEESWPTIIERRIKDCEVLNFGVGGYGPDQCWLRYRYRGAVYKPDIVLICFLTENINRVVNTFRPFYTGPSGLPFTKPYFKLQDDTIELVENPIRRSEELLRLLDRDYVYSLGKDDFWFHYRYGNAHIPRWARRFGIIRLGLTASYQARLQFHNKWNPLLVNGRYDRSVEAYKILHGIVQGFYQEALHNGAKPIVFIQVPPDKLRHWRERGHLVHQALLEDLDSLGIAYVDHASGLDTVGAQYSIDELYHGHPSKLGNRLEAELIIRKLLQLGLVDSSRVGRDPLG